MTGVKGAKCILTALEVSDLEKIRCWHSDPEVWKMTMGYRYPISTTGIARWYEKRDLATNSHTWAIRRQDDPGIEGIISLTDLDEISGVAELSIIVQSKARVGLASDAVDTLCGFASQQLRIRRLWLRVRSENIRAIELYERTGFCREGTLIQHYWADGHFDDVIIMGKFL